MKARLLQERDIRKSKWFEEVAEYFDIDTNLLKIAVPRKRLEPDDESPELKAAREIIRKKFMSLQARQIHDKILSEHPVNITDFERSTSWKDYIFVCINGERSCFQRMFFYDQIINCIVKPMLEAKGHIVVMDYGCGSSLFTRLLSQDFRGKVHTISADICKYAVDFSITRNKRYNPNAYGLLIEDVMATPELENIDIILAYAVFEHLPNSTHQIQTLIDSLSPGGILIENYSGHSSQEPHKSDTFDSYKKRDKNLDILSQKLSLLYGILPQKQNGVYNRDKGDRFWIKGKADSQLAARIRRKLAKSDSLFSKVCKVFNKTLFNRRYL
jgi:SAM-dependent methyltransferase